MATKKSSGRTGGRASASASSRKQSGGSRGSTASRKTASSRTTATSRKQASTRGRTTTARKKTASRGSATSSSRKRSTAAQGRRRAAHPLTDHEEIRNWAESRGAVPSCVRGTGAGEDVGMIRLDFPGYSGEQSLQEISWDDWFQKFDESDLALMVQDVEFGGRPSNFNKLVKRTTAQQRPKARAAR